MFETCLCRRMVSVETRLIPRAVNLQRIGPLPLAEILAQLAELPDIDLLADIQRPDFETRLAILRKKSEYDHLLIGDDILRVPQIATEPHAALHLYGKHEARPGRKMGHVNRVIPK